jgi:hypothetical protein
MPHNLRPEAMVEAGFCYTGQGDYVNCYHCGLIVHDWEATDDPWVEHAVWNPKCEYLILMKGQVFIDNVKSLGTNRNALTADTQAKDHHEEKEDDSPPKVMCRICLEEETRFVVQPCGHFCMCGDCVVQLNHCPICRAEIESRIHAFLS